MFSVCVPRSAASPRSPPRGAPAPADTFSPDTSPEKTTDEARRRFRFFSKKFVKSAGNNFRITILALFLRLILLIIIDKKKIIIIIKSRILPSSLGCVRLERVISRAGRTETFARSRRGSSTPSPLRRKASLNVAPCGRRLSTPRIYIKYVIRERDKHVSARLCTVAVLVSHRHGKIYAQ